MRDHSKTLIRAIRQTIRTYRMFQAGDHVLIGVSGGPDSVALLGVLNTISREYGLYLAIAHLNHDLRGASSNRDASFVTELANRMQLDIFSEKKDVNAYRRRHRLSLETAAREVRYAFFNKICHDHGFNKIALGHHRDDNAEQVLMNLLRGCGPTGLSGIPPVRDGQIVRPMINVSRKQIMAYLVRENMSYVVDTSNSDRNHLRNRIRHELLPHLMAEYNPRLIESLNQMAGVFYSESRWIEGLMDSVFKKVVLEQTDQSIVFSVPETMDLDTAVQRRLFRMALKYIIGDLKKISFVHIETIRSLLYHRKPPKSIDLPRQIRARRIDQTVILYREKMPLRRIPPNRATAKRPCFSYTLQPPGELLIKEVGLKLMFHIDDLERPLPSFDDHDPTAYLDADQLTLPLVVRSQEPLDRFAPLGLGGTQSVDKFLSTRKKRRHTGALCPVMVSANQIVWVVGYGIADTVKISAETRRILKVEVYLA